MLPPLLRLLLLLLLLLLAPPASAELWQLAGVVAGPRGGGSSSESLFAFSVSVAKASRPADAELLIGDPAAFDPTTRGTTGIVYKQQVSRLLSGSSFERPEIAEALRKIQFSYSNASDKVVNINVTRFGATISSLDSGESLICAPGYNTRQGELIASYGVCQLRTATSTHWLGNIFSTNGTQNYTVKGRGKDAEMHLGGFAAQLLKTNDGDYTMCLSGPVSQRYSLSIVRFTPATGKRTVHVFTYLAGSRRQLRLEWDFKNYLGYSLASSSTGRLFAPQPIATTRASGLYVEISATPLGNTAVRTAGEFQKYQQRSYSYMGYASAVLEFRKSGETAIIASYLLLGAPYRTDPDDVENPDNGCVFFLKVIGAANPVQEMPPRYCNSEPNGRFGASIANVGDINQDGADDFAVGCPGCGNNTGAVYLFFGRKDYAGASLRPYQIVRADRLSPKLSGFGFSLDAAAPNGQRGLLAVGAVASRHAVLLQAQPVCTFAFLDPTLPLQMSILSLFQAYDHQLTILIACTNINLRDTMSVSISMEEYVEDPQYRRFNINCTEASSYTSRGSVEKRLKVNVVPVSRSQHHVPLSVMLRDVRIRLRWNFTEYPFTREGVMQFADEIYTGTANESVVTLIKITPCDKCPKNADVGLRLLSPSLMELETHNKVSATLEIFKNHYSFFGGLAIRLTPSKGVFVTNEIEATADIEPMYFTDQQEIKISEVFPLKNDLFASDARLRFNITLNLTFGSTLPQYTIDFKLVNHVDEDRSSEKFGSVDSDPSNNEATMEIKVNTSLVLDIYPKRGEDTIVDVRKQSSSAQLHSLTSPVHGSSIGPELTQTYKLYVATKPPLPVEGIVITVALPFVTVRDELLLYFARKIIVAKGAKAQGEVPGVPYVSTNEDDADDTESSVISECLPLDEDLAKLLHSPDLVLLETAHVSSKPNDTSDEDVSKRRVVRSVDKQTEEEPDPVASNAASGAETEKESQKLAIVKLFDCDRPEVAPIGFRCIRFRCELSLKPQQSRSQMQAFLHLHARLWSPTFFKYRLPMLKMRSSVELDWKQTSAFNSVNVTRHTSFTQTFVFEGIELPPEDYPWGYVVLAIFIGLWLLLLCILLLWYCNFFRRKKFDYQAVRQKPAPNDDDFYH